LQENGIRLRVLGSRDRLSKGVLKAIDEAELKTAGNTRGTLAVCFNYGGQLEIADACKKIVQEGIAPEDITLDTIAEHLYVPEVPPLDIVVRTSGEQRTSNFMLWRAAYSEFIFLEKLWPDMTKDDVAAILEEYSRRGRRFGG
jgi:undecaprenyl diphosphate synthase